MSHLIQIRMSVYLQRLLTTFSASDIDSDSKEELDSQHNPEHDASDQAGKNKNTYKSDDRFPAGRTVKWKELVT